MTQEKKSFLDKPWAKTLIGTIIILGILTGALVYKSLSSRVVIDRSVISAPIISISPTTAGVLDEVYVLSGSEVKAGQALARVGGEILISKVDGTIIKLSNTPGQVFSPSQPVLQMIVPKELRIIGTIKENEGLSDLKEGNAVTFTVDAFDGEQYEGVVESINVTSKDSGVVFSISDKREVKEFEINVKYDVEKYNYFKNGMSAKMKVYTK